MVEPDALQNRECGHGLTFCWRDGSFVNEIYGSIPYAGGLTQSSHFSPKTQVHIFLKSSHLEMKWTSYMHAQGFPEGILDHRSAFSFISFIFILKMKEMKNRVLGRKVSIFVQKI